MDDLRFSQRMGITPVTKKLQVDNMDDDLRNGLWNIYNNLLKKWKYEIYKTKQPDFAINLWVIFFKKKLDEIPGKNPGTQLSLSGYVYGGFNFDEFKRYIRDFFFECLWHEVYDLIEYSLKKLNISKTASSIFNNIFQRENSAYRFIDGMLAPITNSKEIEEIQKAIDISRSFTALEGCNIHLTEALNKLSDKQNPDYRNSIKESISAVESIAKIISGKKNDSLGASLNRIKGKLKLHQALEQGFKNIYGYTSDEGGVRHAIMDNSNCDIEDARFMLVSCSAFVNYLIAKAAKADIKFA